MGLFPKESSFYKGEELINAAKSLYQRLRNAKTYDPKYKLRSPVRLFKAETVSLVGAETDFGLSNICEHKVEVYTLSGNHATILSNPQLAQYINDAIAK